MARLPVPMGPCSNGRLGKEVNEKVTGVNPSCEGSNVVKAAQSGRQAESCFQGGVQGKMPPDEVMPKLRRDCHEKASEEPKR